MARGGLWYFPSMPRTYVLEREQCFAQPRQELFRFFADAGNLSTITPPFLSFRILTPMPMEMHAGARLAYRLKLYGMPVSWHTLIESYEEPHAFVDRQVSGPYRLWHHTHTFTDLPGGGTHMRDVVRYQLPFGPLGRLTHALLVKRTVERIFDWRYEKLREIHGPGPAGSPAG